jgi:hypothetical protein
VVTLPPLNEPDELEEEALLCVVEDWPEDVDEETGCEVPSALL